MSLAQHHRCCTHGAPRTRVSEIRLVRPLRVSRHIRPAAIGGPGPGNSRHAELLGGQGRPGATSAGQRPDVEADDRFARSDMSIAHAFAARQAFAKAIRGGEPGMNLAQAALWASAEDDALSSHSTIELPVPSFLERLDAVAQHVKQQLAQALPPTSPAASPTGKADAGKEAAPAAKQPAPSGGKLSFLTSSPRQVNDIQLENQNLRSVPAAEGAGPAGSYSIAQAEEVLKVVEAALFVKPAPRPFPGAAPGSAAAAAGNTAERGNQGRPQAGAAMAAAAAGSAAAPAPRTMRARWQQWQEQHKGVNCLGFKVPEHGRSALPNNTVVHHAGAWEDSRDGYLHETLIRRHGHPAALAIIYAEVMRRLLEEGVVDFAVRMELNDYDGEEQGWLDPPTGVPLPGVTRASLQQQQGLPSPITAAKGVIGGLLGVLDPYARNAATAGAGSSSSSAGTGDAPMRHLNSCSGDVVCELQRHLKRSYWPWEWDNSSADSYEDGGNNSWGGFRAAAKAALGQGVSATVQAVSKAAASRIERGVSTSPGAGDIRRATAATERLVLLSEACHADEKTCMNERRDLAVLRLHQGDLAGARAELQTVMHSRYFRVGMEQQDRELCYKLAELVKDVKVPKGEPEPQ
ncbi:hypothetical protein QJQ45_008625 [Haematococcus lacustris]|nr:hypothetical protein QJQ45_008625 [Haematococcus lacustris]